MSFPLLFTCEKYIDTMAFVIKMTENQLIDDCLAGDRLAQKALYDKYSRAMYTTAYRITNDFEEASDVLQDAFIKVFQNLHTFRRSSTLGAWIKTIVVRTAISKVRKLKYTESIDQVNPNDWVDWGNRLDGEHLEKAIQALPSGYRTIFSLIEIEGYQHKEVAELLGITVGTSKSQLFYAKKKLRENITRLLEYGL